MIIAEAALDRPIFPTRRNWDYTDLEGKML